MTGIYFEHWVTISRILESETVLNVTVQPAVSINAWPSIGMKRWHALANQQAS